MIDECTGSLLPAHAPVLGDALKMPITLGQGGPIGGTPERPIVFCVKTMSDYPPSSITTDKLASYPRELRSRLEKVP
jgi:hypothetical protein